MKAPTLRPQPLALAIAVAAGTLPLTSFAAAGKVHFAFGQVSAENTAGESRKLKTRPRPRARRHHHHRTRPRAAALH